MSDFWHRTDTELDLAQRDAESALLYPKTEREERIAFWYGKRGNYDEAVSIADAEIRLRDMMEERG